MNEHGLRQIRAAYTDDTVVVYQAYSPGIAKPAVAGQRFVSPFKLDRMTWIKPSFLWMMYRSGWALKPGQEHILAITITREGFEWALNHACLSSARAAGVEADAWDAYKRQHPVRIQWDPERELDLQPQERRAIQIGLSGEAVPKYVNDWTLRIEDLTSLARRVHGLVLDGQTEAAWAALPVERPYPNAEPWASRLRLTEG